MTITLYNPIMAMQHPHSPTSEGENESVMVEEIVSFGRALRFYRDRARMTQVELASQVPMRATTLSNWEGRADPPTDFYALNEIAGILGVDVADLMAGRIRRPKVTIEPLDEVAELAFALSKKYKGRTTPEEALEILSGYLDLGDEERQHVRKQIGLLRRIPPHPPTPTNETPNDAGGRDK